MDMSGPSVRRQACVGRDSEFDVLVEVNTNVQADVLRYMWSTKPLMRNISVRKADVCFSATVSDSTRDIYCLMHAVRFMSHWESVCVKRERYDAIVLMSSILSAAQRILLSHCPFSLSLSSSLSPLTPHCQWIRVQFTATLTTLALWLVCLS